MSTTNRRIATAIALAVATLGALQAPAMADPSTDTAAPCAKQEQHVAKATDALARVTAVFERQKDKVAKAMEQLAAATTDAERAKAQAKLDRALAKKADVKKVKKAQKQRLAKAQARLDSCLAANPT